MNTPFLKILTIIALFIWGPLAIGQSLENDNSSTHDLSGIELDGLSNLGNVDWSDPNWGLNLDPGSDSEAEGYYHIPPDNIVGGNNSQFRDLSEIQSALGGGGGRVELADEDDSYQFRFNVRLQSGQIIWESMESSFIYRANDYGQIPVDQILRGNRPRASEFVPLVEDIQKGFDLLSR